MNNPKVVTNQRILILGASGFIGNYLYNKLKFKNIVLGTTCKKHSNEFTTLDFLEIESLRKIFFDFKPTIVIHVAGISRISSFNTTPLESTRINYQGTKNITDCSLEYDCKLIFFSSAFVFSGNKVQAYKTVDIPNPVTHYGKSKFLEENYIKSIKTNHIIVRTDLIFGYNGRNKSNGLIDFLLKNDTATFSEYEIRKPLFIEDLSDILVNMMQRDFRGTIHLSGNELISYYDFAKNISNKIKSDTIILNSDKHTKIPVLSMEDSIDVKITPLEIAFEKIARQMYE